MSDQDEQRYHVAMHAIQSAVLWAMSGGDPNYHATEPKHLRVGIDSAHISDLALAELLIAKGVFSRAEYIAAVADAAERELATWHERARRATGTDQLHFR